MKTVIFAILLLSLCQLPVLAAGTVHYAPLTPELLASGVKIIDIRTEKEWRETGVVKGALGLTFYREDMSYDAKAFLATLQQHVKPNDRIALLCRTGNRSDKVSRYLVQQGFTSVTNIDGGVTRAREAGIKLVPYQKDNAFIAIRQ
ncbi:sulfurtransferase [Geomonas limicola]|uniref:Sulfurtransferase n=1 Tax=Geomonas limicola TaxID=2740186 RepID=A0A6V8NIT5_9BACT|nr:rhodanese-like domain-containing protein [Geomonas limicola]GFO70819.1 sulfurtransferase [Geomonas limicola]